MSTEFLTELKNKGQLVTDYILNYPAIVKISPDYLREGVMFYVAKGGKRLRPALLMWACELAGGKAELALPAAAAIELSHTWTLVHDDIIDNDDLRRGGPSMHAYFREAWRSRVEEGNLESWSRNLAMLVGDIQQATATSMLEALSVDVALKEWLVQDLTTNWVTEVLQGEMLDMEFAVSPLEQISEAQIIDMLNKKTASTLAWCGRTGILVGLGKLELQHPFISIVETICRQAGLAFQLHDDILGLLGNEQELGKPVGSDIREGKRTIIVAHAYARASLEEKELISRVLGNRQASDSEISQVKDLLIRLGGVDYAQKLAADYIEQAQIALNSLPDHPTKGYFKEWIDFIIERSF
ncbi:MAG: polyprenyl synthetase family protein [Patescibacteria group bacterium]|jgi:geranylgeranyl diphosphate synthase type I